MTGRAIITIYTVDSDGLGSGAQTYIAKVGEELKIQHPLETNVSSIVVDRVEED